MTFISNLVAEKLIWDAHQPNVNNNKILLVPNLLVNLAENISIRMN